MFTLGDLDRAVSNELDRDAYSVVVEVDGTTIADGLHQNEVQSITFDKDNHKVIIKMVAE